jgi:single-strand DNA-binding protein
VSSHNHCTFLGNLTRDVEVRNTAGGGVVASFGIATNKKWKDKDGNEKEEVCFLDCTAWGKLAEICGQYLMKGRQVLVTGRLRLEAWEDKATHDKRSKHVLACDTVTFVGPAKGGTDHDQGEQRPPVATAPRPARTAAPAGSAPVADDEPPF